MCCVRYVCVSSWLNWVENGSSVLSTCILKSPVIKNSCGVVDAEPRKEVNSSRNFPNEVEYLDDDGGR